MTTIQVHKLDASGTETWSYQGTLLSLSEDSLTLEARFDLERVELPGFKLLRGDRFIETYFFHRWYTVYTIYDAGGAQLKGWYCDIARPARLNAGHLYFEDLALDLVISPSGQLRIVDEDEFARLELPSEERRKALEAMREIQALVSRREGPFRALRQAPASTR
jgi:predicted RNA-binding protein associated with RNAse of E/G family